MQLTETNFGEASERMTLSKFESIHTLCQHLVALTLDGFACDLGANDARHVEAFPIATRMKALRLVNIQIGNSIFLLYWGHKYQNIRSLDINIGHLLLESPENLRMKAALSTMATQFSDLKKVKAKFSEMYLPHGSFLRGLQASGAHLQDISVSFRNHDQPYYQASILSFKSLVAFSHQTLKRIEIINFWNIGDLTPIRRCRRLEQLILEKEPLSAGTGLPFHAVLDDFPRLKHLKLANFYALVMEEHANRTPRPLQSLTLCDTTVYTQLFDYVAAKCPNLNTLDVTQCRKIYDGQLQVTINMPHHVFKLIIIEDLYLGLRSSNFFDRSDKCSTLVSLEKTRNQPELPLDKKWYHQLLSRRSTKSPEKWYHVYRESRYNPLPLLQQIKGLHVRRIKKFKMTSKQWDQLKEADDFSCCYGPKNKWSLDIQRGYFSVRCKSVHQFTFQDINLE